MPRPTVFGSYALLQVRHGASQSDIRKAYRAAILREHPDKGGTAETFQAVSDAYNVLTEHIQRVARIRVALVSQSAKQDQPDVHTDTEDEPELPACVGRSRRQAPQEIARGQFLKRRKTMQTCDTARASPAKSRGPGRGAPRGENSDDLLKTSREAEVESMSPSTGYVNSKVESMSFVAGGGGRPDFAESQRPTKKRQSRTKPQTQSDNRSRDANTSESSVQSPKIEIFRHGETSTPGADEANSSHVVEATTCVEDSRRVEGSRPGNDFEKPLLAEALKHAETLSDAETSSLGGSSVTSSHSECHSETPRHGSHIGGAYAQRRGQHTTVVTRNPRFLAMLARVREREAREGERSH